MISVEIKEGNVENLKVFGNVVDVAVDTVCAVRSIFEALKKTNKEVAKIFKDMLSTAFESGIVWVENEQEAEEITEQEIRKIKLSEIEDLIAKFRKKK